MLATNKSVADLKMRECSIQGEGAVCLAKAMERNSTVRSLTSVTIQLGQNVQWPLLVCLRRINVWDLCGGSVGVE